MLMPGVSRVDFIICKVLLASSRSAWQRMGRLTDHGVLVAVVSYVVFTIGMTAYATVAFNLFYLRIVFVCYPLFSHFLSEGFIQINSASFIPSRYRKKVALDTP